GAPVGVKDILGSKQSNVLELMPNPATLTIHLKIASDAPNMTVRIADLQGRQISEQWLPNGVNLDISSLANGLYVVTATTPLGKVFSNKFRKQG
ncbi:MAG: T9SS type A sorting domain-containing protein, partial [Phycisphaerae bacterium]|nr:T9SS type A sorting domain-containing protein [Saprospiraceae bacterium]